ncbi:AAA family ATPase [Clostridium estertheticum]|uniref:AAA family ATPase n=1 Tax=Clostridium estertheticum TaxID=238834 RepID=UPI001C0DBFA7|nr:AAA family ATPase [Clostridium estertheticum]MBU3075606.1 AAA family ATPase [Clostridium estertheticum]MBU3164812.1 AAA family ATPase [Clostridium estertheticum]
MSKIVMPKNSALINEIEAVFKIYYEENDWLSNDVYKTRLKELIGGEQYSSSYTKKSQMTSYFGFTTWEDFSNRQSKRRITDSGKRFYIALIHDDKEEMQEELMVSLENTTFGRNNCGCSETNSDVEPPALFIRAILDLEYLTYKEFAFLIWKLEDVGGNYTDAIEELKNMRETGTFSLDQNAIKYSDAKPIEMLVRWGFLAEGASLGTSKKIVISSEVLAKYKNRFLNLKIYNIDKNVKLDLYKTPFNTEINHPYNRIVFGAPGTGKSHRLEEDKEDFHGNYERVTFHPNYSYAQFVGTYKPVPVKEKDEKGVDITNITYKYVPGPFMRIYVKAKKSLKSTNPQPFLLLIEEINRANVAAVFGEVFQLLDRKDGESEYEIETSEDMRAYLLEKLDGDESEYVRIKIPNNMYIWATMNSADQGVFPMDTAFKRRWDFEYIGINENCKGIKDVMVRLGRGDNKHEVNWNKLRISINDKLSSPLCKVNEDKLLGPYFLSNDIIKLEKGTNFVMNNEKFIETFKNKVLMYLYEDAAKQHKQKLFEGCDYSKYSSICEAFDKNGEKIFGDDIKAAVSEGE